MRLVMADRIKDTVLESEPVVIEVVDGRAVLHLDDGEEIAFDLRDLQEALTSEELADEAAA